MCGFQYKLLVQYDQYTIMQYSGVHYMAIFCDMLYMRRVAVIGLPNCGKSTIVNQLMKQKVNCLNVCICARDAGLL